MEEENKSKEDHLMSFIEKTEQNNTTEIPLMTNEFVPGSRKVEKIEIDSEYNNIDLDILPYGKFYPIGTKIYVRPVRTKEIEAFSVVNDKNSYDVQNKINELLASCVKIEYIDGSKGTSKDLQHGDTDTLAIIIARVSAKNGRKIQKAFKCDCDYIDEQHIELIPANYVYPEMNEDLKYFFNADKRLFEIELNNGVITKLMPPTVGIVESINNYVLYLSVKAQSEGTNPELNMSFIKNIPYILSGRGVKSLDIDEIKQEEFNYSKMNEELFMVIDEAIDMMAFGIKKIKDKCKSCNKEKSLDFGFPNGARSLFVIPNAFRSLTKQRV